MRFYDHNRLNYKSNQDVIVGAKPAIFSSSSSIETQTTNSHTLNLLGITPQIQTPYSRHPAAKYFESSSEETYQDTEPAEWHWYFWQYMKQTSEQRYQDMKNQIHGFGHGGIDGSVDSRECEPTCRFYPPEGRIEAIEVLHYYEKYQGFKEALASWNAIL